MLRERITPSSEVIRARFLEDSPCFGAPHQMRPGRTAGRNRGPVIRRPERRERHPGLIAGLPASLISKHNAEVIRAIVLEDRPLFLHGLCITHLARPAL